MPRSDADGKADSPSTPGGIACIWRGAGISRARAAATQCRMARPLHRLRRAFRQEGMRKATSVIFSI